MRQAVQDIRQKVVEEGWFGRVVSAAPVVETERDSSSVQAASAPAQSQAMEPERRPTFEELWGPKEAQPRADQAHEREHHSEIDIDR